MKSFILIWFLFFVICISGCSVSEGYSMLPGEYEREFSSTITKTVGYRYHAYIPPAHPDKIRYPLLLFLHGAGERGRNLDLVKLHGLHNMVSVHDPFPFIVVSPQVPEQGWWDSEILNALLDYAVEKYPVDKTRIYVTGLSMGGYGTWDLISRYPHLFAAAIPICGGGNRLLVHNAKNVPVWAFHGDADPVIPLDRSVEMIDALKQAGGDARLTVYPDTGHDAWTET